MYASSSNTSFESACRVTSIGFSGQQFKDYKDSYLVAYFSKREPKDYFSCCSTRGTMAFQTKAVHDWSHIDVQNWLQAGFAGNSAGWTAKLSRDYKALFCACDFNGGSIIAMQSFTRDQWLAMGQELSDQDCVRHASTVTLGDRMRIVADVQARVASRAAAQKPVEAETRSRSQPRTHDTGHSNFSLN